VKKLWSEIKYWVVILIVLAVLFELVASMILFRKYTPAKSATFHLISSMFSKGDAGQFAYEPWMMFRLSDYRSDEVNINGFERKSIPDSYVKNSSTDTIDIYFFGGNSMFGEHLTDSQTIPSKFVKAYQQDNPSASIRVKNFGIPHYYSKQELMLLTSLVFKGDHPDVVIFLDGLNDFYPSRMLYYDKPYFSYALQQTFEGKMFQKGHDTFVDSTDELYNDPPGISTVDYNNALISKYTNNLRMAASLCKTAGIKCYFFCEPVPFYHKGPATENYFKGDWQRFEHIYDEIQKNKDSLTNFYFLGDMEGVSYIDKLNYSSASTEKIAKQILSTVKKDLQ
jgi:hypothetical protein